MQDFWRKVSLMSYNNWTQRIRPALKSFVHYICSVIPSSPEERIGWLLSPRGQKPECFNTGILRTKVSRIRLEFRSGFLTTESDAQLHSSKLNALEHRGRSQDSMRCPPLSIKSTRRRGGRQNGKYHCEWAILAFDCFGWNLTQSASNMTLKIPTSRNDALIYLL